MCVNGEGMTRASITNDRDSRLKRSPQEGHGRVLHRWEAVEYERQLPWWRLVLIACLLIWLALVGIALGDWLLTVVLVAAVAAVGLVLGSRPRRWHACLSASAVELINAEKPGLHEVLPLERYRGFFVDQMLTRDGSSHRSIVLLPHRRVALSPTVYLADNDAEDERTIDAFRSALPEIGRPELGLAGRIFDSATRWLR